MSTPLVGSDHHPALLAQARRMEEVLRLLAASTEPDTLEGAMLVACLENLLSGDDFESLFHAPLDGQQRNESHRP
jgi:hypothetical protein